MRTNTNRILSALLLLIIFSGCMTNKNLDAYVSAHYNDQIPKIDKKKNSDIVYTSVYNSGPAISTTVHKVSKFLPLIVWWSWDNRKTTSLNPQIAINSFINTVNGLAAKSIAPKLGNKKLELKIEQVPASFAMVDKAHAIFVGIYLFSWDRLYTEADKKDLIVSYVVSDNGQPVKTGKISVPSKNNNAERRWFQSWKSAVSEHLGEYNVNITIMSRSFVTKLAEEIN
jgi:hypothetical protein